MPASTAGYRVIGEETKLPMPLPPPQPAPVAAPSAPAVVSASGGPENGAVARLQAVARGAGAAAVGARDAVAQLINAPMPTVTLTTEPLDPGTDLPVRERVALVLQYCRPWGEFIDLSGGMNVPDASEVKRRVAHNVEVFFYNYLVVAFAVLAALAVFHPLRAALMALPVVVAVLVYVIFPHAYRVTDTLYVDRTAKHVMVASLALLVLTVGHVLSLLVLFVACFTPLLVVHAVLREHEAMPETSAI